jgi:hypothetical protein
MFMPGRPILNDRQRDLLRELIVFLKPSEEDMKIYTYSLQSRFFPEASINFINQWLGSHSTKEKLYVLEKLDEAYPANRFSLSYSQDNLQQELEQLSEKFDNNNLPYEFSFENDVERIDYLNTFKSLQANKSIELESLLITNVQTFCLTLQAGIKYVAPTYANAHEPKQEDTMPQSTLNLGKLELNPESYNKSKGELHLDPFHTIEFAANGKVKRKDGVTYDQPRLLECVFKTVNTLEKGVLFSTVLGVHKDIIGKRHQTKIENTVYEINTKAKEQAGVKNLIKILGSKVYLNSSYL